MAAGGEGGACDLKKIERRAAVCAILALVLAAGMALFLCFFVFMLNQDIQRFVLGG